MITVTELITGGRVEAEALMVDACQISGPGTGPVFNEATGLYTSTPGPLLYSGKCKRQTTQRFEQTAASGDHLFMESRLILHLPVSAPQVPSGSAVLMTACPNDPHSVGQQLVVAGPAGKTWATAQRLNVSEVVA